MATTPASEPKVTISTPKATANPNGVGTKNMAFLFGKENYVIMLIGLAVIILGFVLMSGGKSADPNVFKDSEIYSFTRITLAPFLVIAGLVIEGYAIMKNLSNMPICQ